MFIKRCKALNRNSWNRFDSCRLMMLMNRVQVKCQRKGKESFWQPDPQADPDFILYLIYSQLYPYHYNRKVIGLVQLSMTQDAGSKLFFTSCAHVCIYMCGSRGVGYGGGERYGSGLKVEMTCCAIWSTRQWQIYCFIPPLVGISY